MVVEVVGCNKGKVGVGCQSESVWAERVIVTACTLCLRCDTKQATSSFWQKGEHERKKGEFLLERETH